MDMDDPAHPGEIIREDDLWQARQRAGDIKVAPFPAPTRV